MPAMAGSSAVVAGDLYLAAAGLNRDMLPVFLGLLLAAAVAWLFLSKRLYDELRQNFPGLHAALGQPAFFINRGFAANIRVLRFLLGREYEATGDGTIIRLCRGMRSLLVIYAVCLAGCLLLLLA